jgi:hypothetical protein
VEKEFNVEIKGKTDFIKNGALRHWVEGIWAAMHANFHYAKAA